MSKKSSKTFRLAFIRRRINTTFRSRALRAALLAELNGEEDAAPEAQVRPVDPPTQAVATPQPDQVALPDGLTAANAVEISGSEDELVQGMMITPDRRRRLREQLQSWRSSSSD